MRSVRAWKIIAAALAGITAGLAAFTFGYARGYSYLTNDPQACANCHIMSEHFAAWMKGSHHAVATCNDCHTPHNLVGKYTVKARNGFWHSFYFTTGRFPDPLRITERNRVVTEGACRYCHSEIVDAIEHGPRRSGPSAHDESVTSEPERGLSCVRCHTHVGHWVR
jgi:cytochrome c nitrite reductase small subunit